MVPFWQDGKKWHQMDYISKSILKDPSLLLSGWKLVPNYQFKATLQIIEAKGGRSAAGFVLEDEQGCHYSMFMKDAMDIILSMDIHKGRIFGTWSFKKCGSNFGIYRLFEEAWQPYVDWPRGI